MERQNHSGTKSGDDSYCRKQGANMVPYIENIGLLALLALFEHLRAC